MVFTDRLSKGVILEPCETIEAEYIAKLFIRTFYRRHGLPSAIVSDRGSQFVSQLWKRMCQLLKIERRISTAFHPETDGQTERMNTEIEVILRHWVNRTQDDWSDWLPAVELVLNGRESSSTGVSSFFLSHGYHLDPLNVLEDPVSYEVPSTPIQKGEAIVAKIQQATEWAQVSMAAAQQDQETKTNRHRSVSPSYKVGDKVWLNLKNIRTDRPSKKLEDRATKFTITEVVGPYSYRLDLPYGVHNVFNVDLLRPAASDPFPSQIQTDDQPPPVLVDDEEEWVIERIEDERRKRMGGRGKRTRLEYLVKWKGYARSTWEPASALEDVAALDDYLQKRGGGDVTG
jgi:hypothetical protein